MLGEVKEQRERCANLGQITDSAGGVRHKKTGFCNFNETSKSFYLTSALLIKLLNYVIVFGTV